MLDFLELEETVGKRLASPGRGRRRPIRATPSTRCRWRRCAAGSRSMFRALRRRAGRADRRARAPAGLGHRLGWRQRIGLGDGAAGAARARRRDAVPARDDRDLPDAGLNAALYRWLAAWFCGRARRRPSPRPIRCGAIILVLRRGQASRGARCWRHVPASPRTMRGCAPRPRPWPGRSRPLPRLRAGDRGDRAGRCSAPGPPPEGALWTASCVTGPTAGQGAARLPPILPCPLWGDAWLREAGPAGRGPTTRPGPRPRQRHRPRPASASPCASRTTRRAASATRSCSTASKRSSAMAEMINVDRPADEDEDEDAEKAADDLEELTVGQPHRQAGEQAEIRPRPAARGRR